MSTPFPGDLYGGTYSVDELSKIFEMNKRMEGTMKPNDAFYQKSMRELKPSWAQKREFVHFLINDSNVSPISKNYLKDAEAAVAKWQYRGFKYGLLSSTLTYAFFPVIRRQPFTRRFLFSMLPFAYFMNWGHVWGHEIFAGTRSKFTMK